MALAKSAQMSLALVLCAALPLMVVPPASGAARNDPFGRDSYGPSEAGSELLKQSAPQVLEAPRQGATATWAGKQSGRAGRATLLRVFERGDGTWKVAF